MSEQPTRRELRTFAVALVVFLAAVGSALLLWSERPLPGYGLLGAATLAAALGLARLALLRPLYRAVRVVGRPIGVFNSILILSLVYVLFFVPVGLWRRLTGKDPLRRRWQPDAPTYWEERKRKTLEPDDFKLQF